MISDEEDWTVIFLLVDLQQFVGRPMNGHIPLFSLKLLSLLCLIDGFFLIFLDSLCLDRYKSDLLIQLLLLIWHETQIKYKEIDIDCTGKIVD